MALTCLLSPLVFAELYRILSETQDARLEELLEERLDEMGRSKDWLIEAQGAYDSKWRDCVETGQPNQELSAYHSQLASWVLAGLRRAGDSTGLRADLRTAVTERYLEEVPGGPAKTPECCRPTVVGWTLGRVVGDFTFELPVVPAMPLANPQIAAAYDGLVEHVVFLGSLKKEPWLEMLGTSTFWRGAGIAEAIYPNLNGPHAAINTLLTEARPLLPPMAQTSLNDHWAIDFVDKRNVLTHILADAQRPDFMTVAGSANTTDLIEQTVFGVTQFVFQRISGGLAESGTRVVRAELWDTIRWDLNLFTVDEP